MKIIFYLLTRKVKIDVVTEKGGGPIKLAYLISVYLN